MEDKLNSLKSLKLNPQYKAKVEGEENLNQGDDEVAIEKLVEVDEEEPVELKEENEEI